ncbi:MAG: hypothetical protein ACYC3W_10280 [Candidatus Nanopelagicales bacterium]
MILQALVSVLVAIAVWFVDLFPVGQPNLAIIEGALSDMGFLRLVIPFGTLAAVVNVAVGIWVVVWVAEALIWAWRLVKW